MWWKGFCWKFEWRSLKFGLERMWRIFCCKKGNLLEYGKSAVRLFWTHFLNATWLVKATAAYKFKNIVKLASRSLQESNVREKKLSKSSYLPSNLLQYPRPRLLKSQKVEKETKIEKSTGIRKNRSKNFSKGSKSPVKTAAVGNSALNFSATFSRTFPLLIVAATSFKKIEILNKFWMFHKLFLH